MMISVAIIALLSTIVFASLSDSRKKTRDAVRVGDLKSLSKAAELYFAEHNGAFPANLNAMASYFTDSILPKDPMGDNYAYKKLNHGYCVGAVTEIPLKNPTPDDDADCPTDLGANYIIKGP